MFYKIAMGHQNMDTIVCLHPSIQEWKRVMDYVVKRCYEMLYKCLDVKVDLHISIDGQWCAHNLTCGGPYFQKKIPPSMLTIDHV
jgi:hypothetical protein